MSVFTDILNLLSGPTGGMAYYLILLFCVWAIVGLSLSRPPRDGGDRIPVRQPRILLAGSLISLCRFLPIIVALLDRQDGISLVRLGPPLERFVDTVSALLICSAFVLPTQKKTMNRLIVGMLGLFSLGLYVIAAFQWTSILDTLPSALYNNSVQRWAWELWQLAFLIPAFVYVLVGPVEERDALGSSLGILVLGHLMQAIHPLSDQIPHAAGWVRLANLVAFPLLGVSTYLLIFQRFESEATELHTVNQQSLTQITNLMSLLEANTMLSRSLDLNDVLKNAAIEISKQLQSDLCAVALVPIEPGDPKGQAATELELSVVFDTPQAYFEGIRFTAQDYPVILHAIASNRPAILGSRGPAGFDVSTSAQEIEAIFRLLQSKHLGPLIVQPIASSTPAKDAPTPAIGVMLVCRTDQGRTFTSEEAHKSESLAEYLGPAIENARRYSYAQTHIEQLTADRDALETETVRTRTDLENRLQKSEEQAAAYMQRLYEAEQGEQQAQNDAQQVRREMSRLQQETKKEIAQFRAEIKRGIQHTTQLTQRIAELDAERLRLVNQVETLQADRQTQQVRPAANQQPSPDLATASIAALLDDLGPPTETLLQDTASLVNGSVGTLDSLQRTLLSRVRANAERLHSLRGNLAVLRDIQAGTLAPAPVPTHIAGVIKQTLDNARFRLEQKRLRTRLAIEVVSAVQIDPKIIQRVLDNLLDKLCKNAQEGTTIGIQAFIEQKQDQPAAAATNLHIAVSAAVPRGTLPSPAEKSPLPQANAGAPDKPQIDDEIVQALVQAHRGRVWCVEQPDSGAIVHLTVPVDVRTNRTLHRGERRE